jgi:hypothetical protein
MKVTERFYRDVDVERIATLEVVQIINHNYLYGEKSKNKEELCAFHI